MQIHYDPNETSQTVHTEDTARVNIQGKIKNLRQKFRHICIRQFEVRIHRKAY